MNRIPYDNGPVRRQDRLLDDTAACELLRTGEFGVLSMQAEEGGGYGIPISYVWDGGANIYLHCAPEGRKLRAMDRCPEVSFCVVGRTQVHPSLFTTAYESIVVRCRAVRGLEPEERMHALELLLGKYCPDDRVVGMRYAEKSFYRTEILRLEILAVSGKAKVVRR